MRSRIMYPVFISVFLLSCIIFIVAPGDARGCTSLIVHGKASCTGSPMIWKNRDTDFLSNKILYVRETPYNYIGLANHEDNSGRWIYAGLNSQGFGIINTVAYNLPAASGELLDLEGNVMAEALRGCATVHDFERWLIRNLGPSLGCQTNFLALDALGNAVIFETDNRKFKKYDCSQTPEKYMVNTNFARSGAEGQGNGYLRFERASALLRDRSDLKISHEFLFRVMARDFGHVLLNSPTLCDLPRYSDKTPLWVQTGDTLNRQFTSAAVVIVGKPSPASKTPATLWALLGEPVTGIAVPVWVEAGETPTCLYDGANAPMNAESLRIKKLIRPFSEKDRLYYLCATRLDNSEKSGFLPLLLQTEQEISTDVDAFLKNEHSAEEYAAFQSQMALKALDVLKKIK